MNTAIEQLLEVEGLLKGGVLSSETKGVGMARLGQKTQKVSRNVLLASSANGYVVPTQIVYGTLEQLLRVDFGGPLHCMALCGDMHALEEEVRPVVGYALRTHRADRVH